MLARLWVWYNRYNAWLLMGWAVTFLALIGAYEFGIVEGLIRLAVSWGVGAAVDYLLHRAHTPDYRELPVSGGITGHITLLVLPFDVPLWILIAAIILGLLSKHLLRWKKRHIFNPAGFGIVMVALFMGTKLGWVGDAVVPLTILSLAPVVYRVRKHFQVLSFFVAYLLLLLLTNPLALSGSLLGLFPWFFALAMVSEPITSVPTTRQQLVFGALVALLAFVFSSLPIVADLALPLALLSGNLAAVYLRTSKL